MPIKPCSLHIDANRREIDNRGTPLFPCGGYTTVVGGHARRDIPWHWHNEVEVLAVESGVLRLCLIGERCRLQAGECAFINSGILQSAAAEGESCVVRSLVFHPSLVAGTAQGVVEQRYIRPLLECAQIPGLRFGRDVLWHRQAADDILDAFEAYRSEDFGYELVVREKLSHLWLLIVSNCRQLLGGRGAAHPDTARLKEMLAFIHARYADPIALADIARAASISGRECLRCFKRTMGFSPVQYLLRHRISVAAGLLLQTDRSVTEICRDCGFESPSYFSLVFKRNMEMTPKEYRSRQEKADH